MLFYKNLFKNIYFKFIYINLKHTINPAKTAQMLRKNINKLSDIIFVSLDHKTSHKGQFFKIEIYTSSES